MRPIIKLTSVTYAIRAQKVLERQHIRSVVRKLARDMNVYGCGYGLEIYGDVQMAANILENAGIRIIEIIDG